MLVEIEVRRTELIEHGQAEKKMNADFLLSLFCNDNRQPSKTALFSLVVTLGQKNTERNQHQYSSIEKAQVLDRGTHLL